MIPSVASVPRSSVCLLLVLFTVLPGWAEDAVISAAPRWDCDEHSPHVIWRSRVPGAYAGALGEGNGRILVGSTAVSKEPVESTPGTMNAFDTSGRLLWTATHPRLADRVHDCPASIRCRACFDGPRAYYMSNRGELVCVDFARPRKRDYAGLLDAGAAPVPEDVPILWKLDLPRELGVFKRDASDVGNPLPSPLVIGDLVFCVTAHGAPDFGRRADPQPPSFLAVDKLTGKVAWSSNAPGARIVFSQWSSPVSAVVHGVEEVIFPGGDGVLYAFEPATGRPLWELDCNRLGARELTGEPYGSSHLLEARCGFFAAPTVHGTMLYVALNVDYEIPVPHPLLAIDLATDDGEPRIVWQFGDPAFKGTYNSAAVDGGLVFVTGDDCVLFALDEKTGREC